MVGGRRRAPSPLTVGKGYGDGRRGRRDLVARHGFLDSNELVGRAAAFFRRRSHQPPSAVEGELHRIWWVVVKDTEMEAQQAFSTDLEYYEGRADGIASVAASRLDEARPISPRRHGFRTGTSSSRTSRRCATARSRRRRSCSPTAPLEAGDRGGARASCSTSTRSSSGSAARTATTCSGWPAMPRARPAAARARRRPEPRQRLRLDEAPPGRLPNDRGLAQLMLEAGGRTDLSARGDGGTPLVAALFWGHREVVDLLGLEPRNLRVAAGLGRLDLIASSPGRRQPARTAAFYRPHGGFPAWEPSDDPQEMLDEALVWAAKSRPRRGDRAARRARRARRRGSVPRHAAHVGGGERPRRRRSGGSSSSAPTRTRAARFGGPDHGEGVTALHLAAQSGRGEAVEALLELGADPSDPDELHGGDSGRLGRVRRPSRARGAAAEPKLTGEHVFV